MRTIVDLSWIREKGWVIRPSVLRKLAKEVHSNKDLFEIFYYGKRADKLLFAEIEHAAKNDTNIILEIIGLPGTGKSILGQSLAYYILEAFQRYEHEKSVLFAMNYSSANDALRRIAKEVMDKYRDQDLSPKELRQKYIQELRGYVLITDEQTKQHGKGSRIEQDNFENVINTVRAAQINFVLIYPRRRIEVGHFVIKTIAYHPEKRKNMAILYSDEMDPYGVIFIKKPVEKFPWEEQYWEEKFNKVWKIIEAGGLDVVEGKEKTEKIEVVYQGTLENFDWEPEVFNFLLKRDQRLAWLWWLSFVEGKSPRTHLSEYQEKTGRKKSWIYAKLKEMNQDQAFWGLISEIRGKLWEDYLKKKYESQGFTVWDEEKNIEVYGIKADLLILQGNEPLEVINAKAGASGTSYPPEKFQPEIQLAKRLNIPAYLEFFNINTRRSVKKKIDLDNPKTISF